MSFLLWLPLALVIIFVAFRLLSKHIQCQLDQVWPRIGMLVREIEGIHWKTKALDHRDQALLQKIADLEERLHSLEKRSNGAIASSIIDDGSAEPIAPRPEHCPRGPERCDCEECNSKGRPPAP